MQLGDRLHVLARDAIEWRRHPRWHLLLTLGFHPRVAHVERLECAVRVRERVAEHAHALQRKAVPRLRPRRQPAQVGGVQVEVTQLIVRRGEHLADQAKRVSGEASRLREAERGAAQIERGDGALAIEQRLQQGFDLLLHPRTVARSARAAEREEASAANVASDGRELERAHAAAVAAQQLRHEHYVLLAATDGPALQRERLQRAAAPLQRRRQLQHVAHTKPKALHAQLDELAVLAAERRAEHLHRALSHLSAGLTHHLFQVERAQLRALARDPLADLGQRLERVLRRRLGAGAPGRRRDALGEAERVAVHVERAQRRAACTQRLEKAAQLVARADAEIAQMHLLERRACMRDSICECEQPVLAHTVVGELEAAQRRVSSQDERDDAHLGAAEALALEVELRRAVEKLAHRQLSARDAQL
eukprot:3296042-Pleurochrysis_carterae.AAC.2